MSYPDFSKAFQPEQKVSNTFGDMTLNPYEIGELVLTSGKLVVCNPLYPSPETDPFSANFKPGRYPVILSIAYSPKNNNSIVAYAMLRIEKQTPIKWKLAPLPNLDVDDLEQGGYVGCISDTGIVSFLDEEVFQTLLHSFLYTEIFEDTLPSKLIETLAGNGVTRSWTWANMCVDDLTQANVIAFGSGQDGIYPTYFGYDAEDNIVCVVTDFLVCDLE